MDNDIGVDGQILEANIFFISCKRHVDLIYSFKRRLLCSGHILLKKRISTMIPSSLSEIKALIKSIHIAEKNNQNCPICNSNLTQVGVMWDRPIYGHDCECLLELDLAEAEAEYIDDTDDIIAYYSHINSKKNNIIRCHKGCGKTVDLEDPNCVEDPPYRFRCKICGESLRTHPEYGEGELYDLAKKNITWNFVNRKPTLFNQPFPNQIMM